MAETALIMKPSVRSGRYPYPGPPQSTQTSVVPTGRGIDVIRVSFDSPLPSGEPCNDVVTARFFSPASSAVGQPVVLLPGLFGRRLSFWDSMARSLARRGFPVLLVGLPYLFERRPEGTPRGYPFICVDPARALPAYEQAVADVRASVDWLLDRQGRGGQSAAPALLGVSLGAFISVIASAMEPRLRGLVLMFGGGDLDRVVSGGTYGFRVRRQLRDLSITEEKRRRARLEYDSYLRAVREAEHPLDVRPAFEYFLFDPLTYAHHIRNRPILMINAALDPIVPRTAARALWEGLGRPQSALMWGTHWGGGPWRGYVARRIARFLSTMNRPTV